MPKGIIWKPARDGDFDKLLNGISENKQATFNGFRCLAHIRNPFLCPLELLPDLEREFGVTQNTAIPENTRRAFLAPIIYKQPGLATIMKLQRALDISGFGYGGYGLIVTPNSPPVSPPTIRSVFTMTAHDYPSIYCAGNREIAYCGYAVGYYLKSGDYYYESTEHLEFSTLPEAYWPLVFFVGGEVLRGEGGKITSITPVDIPASRQQELHRIILRVKPVGIWAALFVRYI
jgi:hypothetical protein